MLVKVSHDELERVATLLEEFADESRKEAQKPELATEEVADYLSEAISYTQAAQRLRKVILTEA